MVGDRDMGIMEYIGLTSNSMECLVKNLSGLILPLQQIALKEGFSKCLGVY